MTNQVDLIELHLYIPIQVKDYPTSPRDIYVILGVGLETVVDPTVEHDLVTSTEENTSWGMLAGCNMCPKTVS